MPYWFEPPTRELMRNYQAEPDRVYPVDAASRGLFKYIRRGGSGLSVLKTGGTYVTKETPTSNECDAADIAYLGGHKYLVSDEEGAALAAAGFVVARALATWDDVEATYDTWDEFEADTPTWDALLEGSS
jgi:hypothetical protein